MLKRGLLALAVIAAAVLFSGTAAQAIPTGNNLIVFAYFSDSARTHLIGQKWAGCGEPTGSWGTLSGFETTYYPAC